MYAIQNTLTSPVSARTKSWFLRGNNKQVLEFRTAKEAERALAQYPQLSSDKMGLLCPVTRSVVMIVTA